MFDIDELISDCVAVQSEPLAVKEVLDRALARRGQVTAALPADAAAIEVLYSSAELSVLHVVWGPAMSIPPHDHLMWAVNGIYIGAEDNVYFRRGPGSLVESGGRRIAASESAILGRDVIHAVTNPDRKVCTGSIHVYGGDYVNTQRSMWDPDTLEEGPADGNTVRRLFETYRLGEGSRSRR